MAAALNELGVNCLVCCLVQRRCRGDAKNRHLLISFLQPTCFVADPVFRVTFFNPRYILARSTWRDSPQVTLLGSPLCFCSSLPSLKCHLLSTVSTLGCTYLYTLGPTTINNLQKCTMAFSNSSPVHLCQSCVLFPDPTTLKN